MISNEVRGHLSFVVLPFVFVWPWNIIEDSTSGPLQLDLGLWVFIVNTFSPLSPAKHRRMEYARIFLGSTIKLYLTCIFHLRRRFLILRLTECWIFVVAVLRVTRWLIYKMRLESTRTTGGTHWPPKSLTSVCLPPWLFSIVMCVLNWISGSTSEISFFKFYFLETFFHCCSNLPMWPVKLPQTEGSLPLSASPGISPMWMAYVGGGPRKHK